MKVKVALYQVILFILVTACASSGNNVSKNAASIQKYDPKVEQLLKSMTLQQKVGQMTQITLDVITKGANRYTSNEPLSLDPNELNKAFNQFYVGSVLNTANNRALTRAEWYKLIKEIQLANKEIPVLYGVDAIHGTTYTQDATFFPQQIGMGATFNTNLIEKVAAITAYETRASNIPWDFSPVLDMGRDVRFPRLWETFGEDVLLTSEMGVAMTKGYQGNSNGPIDKYHVAACLKHFLGYGTSYSGKDRTPAYIPANNLSEIHIPAFKASIDAGAKTVMINSGIINGTPVHANKSILTDLLRNQLGFTGIAVTDWADIENLHNRDKVASSQKEAVKMAINAGIDMAMVPYNYEDFCNNLIELVNENEVPLSRIDESVRRILQVKMDLNLFEQSYFELSEYPDFGSNEFQTTAYQTALESITLLKNKGKKLPLSLNNKILVVGPNANSMRTLNGGWSYSWQGDKTEQYAQKYNTILEAVQNKIGKDKVLYSDVLQYKMSGKYDEEIRKDYSDAVSKAQQADFVLLCLGENTYTEKPGDLTDLSISQNQIDLAEALSKSGKPIILVLNEGRPRLIADIEPLADGIFQLYLPGNYGADAFADLLFGDQNPSGKLPYTYPKNANSIITYDYKPSENQEKMTGVYDYESQNDIQFPFGFGLNYSTLLYSNLQTNQKEYSRGATINVTVDVKNTGNMAVNETVMLFSQDLYASITPDNKKLRAFQKVELQPGQQKTVNFVLNTNDLAFVNANNQWVTEPGDFTLLVDNLQTNLKIQ